MIVDDMEITDSENSNGLSKSIVKFTHDMFKVLLETNEQNYICSTFSAHIALSMVAYGADENTAVEMRKVLGISGHDSDLLEYYQRIIDYLNVDENVDGHHSKSDKPSCEEGTKEMSKDQSLSEELQQQSDRMEFGVFSLSRQKIKCIVRLANKIIISDTMQVNEDYEKLLSTYFRSTSETFDFERQQKSAETINNWCAEITNGKIQEIINPDEFTGDTALLLINVVYFKGMWENEFQPAVQKMFYLNLIKRINVPTMYIKRQLDYRELPELNAKSVRLNFTQRERYMEIIVPNSINGLKSIVNNLDKIGEKQFQNVNIRFWLPKFEVRSNIKFENYLAKMGMVDAFDQANANFNKLSPRKLFIKAVLQKAYIKVDELGCEAAAVTTVELEDRCLLIMRKKPKYVTIKADRPFLFRIMDSRLNIPLFVGTVVNPLE